MRTAFFGYGEFGVAGLGALIAAGADVVTTVVPGNRSGGGVDVMREAVRRHGVPVLVQPPRGRIAPFVDSLLALQPELIVVWSYSMILPPEVLRIPPRGAVNIHGGLLPEYRGPHVSQWAIINGEKEFGVTLHYIDEGIDSGPVIAERRFALYDSDDAHALRQRMGQAGLELLRTWWPRLADGTAPSALQDPDRARYWPLRTPDQGRITWSMTAESICRVVRALAANWPGAFVDVNGRRIAIRKAEPRPSVNVSKMPGQVLTVDVSGVRVAARDGDVLVIRAEEAEGSVMEPRALADLLGQVHG